MARCGYRGAFGAGRHPATASTFEVGKIRLGYQIDMSWITHLRSR